MVPVSARPAPQGHMCFVYILLSPPRKGGAHCRLPPLAHTPASRQALIMGWTLKAGMQTASPLDDCDRHVSKPQPGIIKHCGPAVISV